MTNDDNLPEHAYDRPDPADRQPPAPWSTDARRYGFDWDAYAPDDEDKNES